MHELLKWYQLLSNTKSFKWAKFWGLMLGVLLAALGYFWLNGHGFEALLILGLPIIFAASNGLESLSLAYQYSLFMHHQLSAIQTEEGRPVQSSSSIQPAFQTQEEAGDDASGAEETEELPVELSNEAKLMLCQYYVFLYLLFELRITGEESHQKMVGLPFRKYREWMRRLVNSELGLVTSSQGKTVVAPQIDFATALMRISQHDRLNNIWDFPIGVYHDERNWREYDPNVIWANGRRLKVSQHKRRGEDDPPLLPLYPHSLKDLNF